MTYAKFRFFKFKKIVTRVVFRKLQPTQISSNFQTSCCCNLKIRGLGAKPYVAFCYFYFEMNYDVLKWKSPCLLLNKNINHIKNETESKIENSAHGFSVMNFVFQLVNKFQYKNKTVLGLPKKLGAFFVMFVLFKGNLFNISVLFQCIVY